MFFTNGTSEMDLRWSCHPWMLREGVEQPCTPTLQPASLPRVRAFDGLAQVEAETTVQVFEDVIYPRRNLYHHRPGIALRNPAPAWRQALPSPTRRRSPPVTAWAISTWQGLLSRWLLWTEMATRWSVYRRPSP